MNEVIPVCWQRCLHTIRDTLRHLVSAEVSYVRRVNGRLPEKPLSKEEFPTFEVMKDAARWASPELLAIALATREDSSVRASREKQIEIYPIRSLMVQAINHSTEHRTQIATIITQLGMEPPDMSGWAYMEETGELQITLAEDVS